MQTDPIFEKVFKRIYGLPCWRVSPGWGSFLTFQFGEPHLEIKEPTTPGKNVSEKVRKIKLSRLVFLKGEWQLWINCCDWTVLSKKKLIGKSTSPSTYQKAAEFLDGQKLVRFSLLPKDMRCVFEFDLNGRLETRPYDHKGIQWLFLDKRHNQSLLLRADGNYSYGPSDVAGTEKWKPLWLS